jgi:hypothetical protein
MRASYIYYSALYLHCHRAFLLYYALELERWFNQAELRLLVFVLSFPILKKI